MSKLPLQEFDGEDYEMAEMSAREFRNQGYLQEINRQFLHPLGLAMCVDMDENTFCVLDSRHDKEGWRFDDTDGDYDYEKRKDSIKLEVEKRKGPRTKALGYWIQP